MLLLCLDLNAGFANGTGQQQGLHGITYSRHLVIGYQALWDLTFPAGFNWTLKLLKWEGMRKFWRSVLPEGRSSQFTRPLLVDKFLVGGGFMNTG